MHTTQHSFRPNSDRFQRIDFRKNGLKKIWIFQIVLRPSVKVQSAFTPRKAWKPPVALKNIAQKNHKTGEQREMRLDRLLIGQTN